MGAGQEEQGGTEKIGAKILGRVETEEARVPTKHK